VDATDTAGVDGEAVKAAPAAAEAPTMPKTASQLHLVGLLGLGMLLASLALRRAVRS
jgi:hypothetical protein